jgi:methylated-DNA-[protein]-cysteine S-methyltransferase
MSLLGPVAPLRPTAARRRPPHRACTVRSNTRQRGGAATGHAGWVHDDMELCVREAAPVEELTPVGKRTHTVVDSPVGPLTLVAVDGALAGLYLRRHRHRPPVETFGEPDAEPFTEVASQLRAYFDGRRTDFDLPLAPAGTPFQRRVWTALRDIRYGETVSYGQLAERLGQPTAARAVGLANGRNPISIIVPCHRVVGSTGDLTGYGGGLAAKQYLLAFERGAGETTLF